MTSFLTKLRTIHNRKKEKKVQVLEHNLHIKLLFPLTVWLVTVLIMPPSAAALFSAFITGICITLFFIPLPFWQKTSGSQTILEKLLKYAGLTGFMFMTVITFAENSTIGGQNLANAPVLFFIQFTCFYFSVFLALMLMRKTAVQYIKKTSIAIS